MIATGTNPKIPLTIVEKIKCFKLQKLSERKILQFTGFHSNVRKTLPHLH